MKHEAKNNASPPSSSSPPLTEFGLIARYFTRPQAGSHPLIAQGIGDDCAILNSGTHNLAITTDLLVEGTHFFSDVNAHALGHKALAVNLSDLAAAGAQPVCFFLALALPRVDETWLAQFSGGLFTLADAFGCVLAGGDTTRAPHIGPSYGPITVCITALGQTPLGQAHTRARARAGDEIWVSGELGAAALALRMRRGEVQLASTDAEACLQRMDRPQPRVALGLALRGLAHAVIDVSDGLMADLQHLCKRSGLGATVQAHQVPLAPALRTQSEGLQYRCALAGGDDYELLFTAPPHAHEAVLAAARAANTPVTCMGEMQAQPALTALDAQGKPIALTGMGFDHFA